jgi:LysM repeat protein
MLTISAVVLLHLGIIAVLVGVNGCRTTTGYEKDGDLGAYVGVAGASAASPSSAPTLGGINEVPKPISVTGKTTGAVAKTVGKGGTHTVVANESLWVIARREGVSIDAICAVNNIEQNTVLRVGQKIVIPDGSTPVPARKTTAAKSTGSSAPAAPAGPSPLAAPPGGFGGFGGVAPAAAPEAAKTPTPVVEEKKPAAPATKTSSLAAPAGGFGGFGGVPAATTPTAR